MVLARLDQGGRYYLVRSGGGHDVPLGAYRVYLAAMPAEANETATAQLANQYFLPARRRGAPSFQRSHPKRSSIVRPLLPIGIAK